MRSHVWQQPDWPHGRWSEASLAEARGRSTRYFIQLDAPEPARRLIENIDWK